MPARVSPPAWRRAETVVETEDRLRIEQILAQSRLFLAAVAATATYIDPTEPKVFAAGAYALLGVYVVVAALISVLAHWAPARLLNSLPAVHAVDISTAALVTVLTQGPSSPFMPKTKR